MQTFMEKVRYLLLLVFIAVDKHQIAVCPIVFYADSPEAVREIFFFDQFNRDLSIYIHIHNLSPLLDIVDNFTLQLVEIIGILLESVKRVSSSGGSSLLPFENVFRHFQDFGIFVDALLYLSDL